jgi:hypothetical protein
MTTFDANQLTISGHVRSDAGMERDFKRRTARWAVPCRGHLVVISEQTSAKSPIAKA